MEPDTQVKYLVRARLRRRAISGDKAGVWTVESMAACAETREHIIKA